ESWDVGGCRCRTATGLELYRGRNCGRRRGDLDTVSGCAENDLKENKEAMETVMAEMHSGLFSVGALAGMIKRLDGARGGERSREKRVNKGKARKGK
uniref:hypothetical protein n=1 Tax=Salmonella enterica TaxID=28901 RepID=UPI00398C3E06